MKSRILALYGVLGSVALAAEPAAVSIPRYVDRAKPVDMCGLHAPSLDQMANVLVERGGVREAGGDEKFLAYESLDRTHIWTFARIGNPAYPTVVCRELKDGVGGLEVSMQFVCGGTRLDCESLYGEFLDLNERMKAKARKPPP